MEAFCGRLAVALGLMPTRAALNDANPHVINFYRWLQRGLTIDLPMENRERVFYQHRERFNALLASDQADTREAAGLFYHLNGTGFNGLCRFNSRGEFNVPFGQYEKIGYVTDFSAYRDVFTNWTFTVNDVVDVPLDRRDFVYADPSCDVDFTNYAKGGFSWDDQDRTAVWLSSHPGPVVLVNQATERIERLYRSLGFSIGFLKAPRRISCTGDRTPAREIIGTRNV